jgi:2-keto-3-deoxy-L-rhamnonate aldolase RhmA
MLAEKIKQKLKNKQPSIGTWMTMAHPSIAEILAMSGYEWVVVDTEHSAMDVSEVLHMLIAVKQRGAVPLVRLAGIDPIQAKAVLDSGAAGVIVPMVNTKADAELAVSMTKFPPMGKRGVGLARAQGYGMNFDDYVSRNNEDSLLIVQIEHIDAVNNIDEILSVPGIDGTFIGPYDLSLSLGIPGQLSHPKVTEAKEKVLKAALQKGLIAGVHIVQPATAADECSAAIKEGYTFIALGADNLFLRDGAKNLYTAVSKAIG